MTETDLQWLNDQRCMGMVEVKALLVIGVVVGHLRFHVRMQGREGHCGGNILMRVGS